MPNPRAVAPAGRKNDFWCREAEKRMSRFLAGALRAVTPYPPGEQPRGVETLIKLNTNENPYPPLSLIHISEPTRP